MVIMTILPRSPVFRWLYIDGTIVANVTFDNAAIFVYYEFMVASVSNVTFLRKMKYLLKYLVIFYLSKWNFKMKY